MPSESKNVPGNAMVDVTDAAITAYTKDLSYDKMVALLSLPKRFDKDLKPQSKESKDGEIIKFCNIWARKAQQWHPDSDFSLARDHGHQMLIVALSELIKSGNRYGKPGKE